jgi:hypothetical protein
VTTNIDDEDMLRQVVDRLQEKLPDVAREEIEATARTEFEALSGRPVHDYLAILTERAAKKKLKRGAKAPA